MDVWDGLDESEISRPEILFQFAPVYIYIYIYIYNPPNQSQLKVYILFQFSVLAFPGNRVV